MNQLATDPKRARVPLSIRLALGSGAIAEGTKNAAFNSFLLFYYNQVLGLSGTLSGAAIFLALCVDAITDPLLGSISDNTHSKWGRRHPFMYAAALPMGVCFLLLFNPPDGLDQLGLFAWLACFAIGVRVSMTLHQIPSHALVPEITSDYDERTTLVGYRFFFGWLGGLTIAQLGYRYFFAPAADHSDGRLDPAAYGGFAAVCALLVVASILICARGTHRLIPTLQRPRGHIPLSLGRFAGEVRAALSNRSYVALVIGSMFASVAGGFTEVVGLYVNTYFWGFSTHEISLIGYALAVAVVLGLLIARPLSVRFDKKRTVLGLAGFAIGFGPLPICLRLLDWMPRNGDPALLGLLAAHSMLVVTAVIAIGIVLASMIADVVDENELATGLRQEGMFSAAIAFSAKATSGIGGLLAGIALDVIAFPKLADPGGVPADKVFLLGVVVGPGVFVLYLITLVFLSRYRLTRERHREILDELEQRRVASSRAGSGDGLGSPQ